MDRVLSPEERIRRAEEIYNRRRMQNGVRVSSSKVNSTISEKYRLYKKLILQIAICFMLYFILYLIKNSNYIFSDSFINKTKEFLSYDINFQEIYNSTVDYYNKNMKSYFFNNQVLVNETENTNTIEENTNSIIDEKEKTSVNEVGGIGGGEDNTITTSTNSSEDEIEVVQLSQMEIDAKNIKDNYDLILPLKGTVSSRYGPRQGSKIISSNHAGIDIAANEGTVFVAAMSGTCILASSEGSYGNHLFIQDGDVITVYAHCKKLYVKQGDKITQGQELGEVGQTGNATGPHLHFELRKEDRTVNPELVLSFA